MNLDCINVKFEKFSPKGELQNLFSRVVDRLHMDSPSDSRLKLVITKGRRKFKGCCRIVSKVGVFAAEVCASNPERALAKIEKEIDRQLWVWKRNRFSTMAQAS